jgi:hypothetical protein
MSIQEWQLSFLTHLSALYRPSFNDSTKMQSVDYNWYIGQPQLNDDDTIDDEYLNKGLIAGLIVCGVLLLVSVAYALYLRDKLSNLDDKETGTHYRKLT